MQKSRGKSVNTTQTSMQGDPIYAGIIKASNRSQAHTAKERSAHALGEHLVNLLHRRALIRTAPWPTCTREAAAGHAAAGHTADTAHACTVRTGTVELHHDGVGHGLELLLFGFIFCKSEVSFCTISMC